MSVSKKIAIVSNSTWNIFNFRLNLIRKFKSEGYRIIVIAPIDEYISYLNESYFTKHIPLKRLSAQGKSPLSDLMLTFELYKIYKREKPDIVFHYTIKPNIYGSIAATWAKIPSISILTGLGYTFLNPSFINRIVPWLYKFAFRKINKLILYNPDDLNFFVENNYISKEKCVIIPGSGVNSNFFRPLSANKKNDKFIFLFIGRLLYDKGIEEFVEAAKQVRQIGKHSEFLVVGELNPDNPSAISKDKFFSWVESKYIQYLGSTKDIRRFIKNADCIVLPSYREGVPRAILEAMSMEKPIITTDVAGCRETVVEETNGLLVPAKDSLALAEAMTQLYNLSKEEIELMGKNSREFVLNRFDDKIIVSKYLSLLNEILHNKSNVESKSQGQKVL